MSALELGTVKFYHHVGAPAFVCEVQGAFTVDALQQLERIVNEGPDEPTDCLVTYRVRHSWEDGFDTDVVERVPITLSLSEGSRPWNLP